MAEETYKTQLNNEIVKAEKIEINKDGNVTNLEAKDNTLNVSTGMRVDGKINCDGVEVTSLDAPLDTSKPNISVNTFKNGLVRINDQTGGVTSIGNLSNGAVYIDTFTSGKVYIDGQEVKSIGDSGVKVGADYSVNIDLNEDILKTWQNNATPYQISGGEIKSLWPLTSNKGNMSATSSIVFYQSSGGTVSWPDMILNTEFDKDGSGNGHYFLIKGKTITEVGYTKGNPTCSLSITEQTGNYQYKALVSCSGGKMINRFILYRVPITIQ